MRTVTRRTLLATTGLGLATALAGCREDEGPEPGLYATMAIVVHQRGEGWYDYPEDVGVRVEVQNTSGDRRQGTVEVTLSKAGSEEEWTREREVDVASGTAYGYQFVFEDVADSGEDEFEATAEVVESA